MSDDYDYRACDKLFEQIEPNINYGTHDDPIDVAYKFVRACYRLLRPENVDYAFKELEQRLRKNAAALDSVFPQTDTATLDDEAADAIRQQAERISTLQAKIYLVGMDRDKQAERIAELERADDITMTGFNKAIDERNELQSQLSAAQQRLERWEGQEVVAYRGTSFPIEDDDWCHEQTKELIIEAGYKIIQPLIARLPDAEGEKDETV